MLKLKSRLDLQAFAEEAMSGGEMGGTAGNTDPGFADQGDADDDLFSYDGQSNASSASSGENGSPDGDDYQVFREKYKDRIEEEQGQRIQEAIQRRFKNQQSYEDSYNSLIDGLAPLFLKYGLDGSDIDGLTKALAEDDSLLEDTAFNEGLTPEAVRERLKVNQENARLQKELDRIRQQQQEDNVKLKMNAPDGATFRTNEYTPIVSGSSDYNELDNKPSINGHTLEGDMDSEDLGLFSGDYDDLTNKPTEISAANITNGSSSTTGLISGRRAKSAVEAFAPVKDVKIDGTSVVSGGIAQIPKIPELVTDLGVIDGDQYDWDVETFLNTLQETGSYIFLWDEFKYFVDIKAVEVDGVTTVQQIFWGTEEGPSATSYRNIVVESGEIVQQQTISYLTFQEASSAFSRSNHVHYRTDSKATPVWDYCNTVTLENANPIVIYFDLSTNKTYVIETYVGVRQPVYKMQKVTEMNDVSYFCQRSSYYYSGREHWGDWYKFSGEVFTPPTGR